MAKDGLKLRVLLVEDAALLVDQIRELLGNVGCVGEVLAVATEEEAIHAVSEFEPDLTILDLKLKEGTGFGVLRRIGDSRTKPTVIVFTNYALPNYRELSKLFGADYFLDKTKDFETLPSIIESLESSEAQSRPPTLH